MFMTKPVTMRVKLPSGFHVKCSGSGLREVTEAPVAALMKV